MTKRRQGCGCFWDVCVGLTMDRGMRVQEGQAGEAQAACREQQQAVGSGGSAVAV